MKISQRSTALLRQAQRQRIRPCISRHGLAAAAVQAKCLSSSTRSSFNSTPAPAETGPTTTVDPEEIRHFDALASTWWDPVGPSRLLHLMNPLRHDFIRECLDSSDPERKTRPGREGLDDERKLRYLDVGCGGGIFAESAARLTSTTSVRAIDASAAVLEVARAHARRDPALRPGTGRLTYEQAAVETLALTPEEGYDVVTLFEVLEHVAAPAAFLDSCGAQVRPGGWLVLSTIARTWASWATTKLAAEYLLGIVPRGTHDWSRYVNEHELRDFYAARPGWGLPRSSGVVYVPGLGWKVVPGSEKLGNYFFAVQKDH